MRDNSIPWFYYCIAAGLWLLVWTKRKNWEEASLIALCFIVYSFAVLTRPQGERFHIMLLPFWSYKVPELNVQSILNITIFSMIGFLAVCRYGWKGILIGVGFSLFIESSQFVTGKGLFDIDDIIHNSIGTIIGWQACNALELIMTTSKTKVFHRRSVAVNDLYPLVRNENP